METNRVGACHGCKAALYLTPSGKWITRNGGTVCTKGKYKLDRLGHRMKLPNTGALTMIATNRRNSD